MSFYEKNIHEPIQATPFDSPSEGIERKNKGEHLIKIESNRDPKCQEVFNEKTNKIQQKPVENNLKSHHVSHDLSSNLIIDSLDVSINSSNDIEAQAKVEEQKLARAAKGRRLFQKLDQGVEKAVPLINFDQVKLRGNLDKSLVKIKLKFEGLCEIICNKILLNNLLEDPTFTLPHDFFDKITAEALNDINTKKSHLLYNSSFFELALGYLFHIYPDNIFADDQKKLVEVDPHDKSIKKINREILAKGLDNIENGETIKLETFKKKGLSFYGHSCLIKKVSEDNYSFFDPNRGQFTDLTKDELANFIDDQLEKWEGTDIYMVKGSDYVKRLKNAKVSDVANENLRK